MMYRLLEVSPGDGQTVVAVRQSWDRYTRSWVTFMVDSRGHQVGDAAYDGTRADAEASMTAYLRNVGKTFA